MKTLRFQLPVLAHEDVERFLDLITRVDGVMAALVDEPHARLVVAVSCEASAMLVREQVRTALMATAATA